MANNKGSGKKGSGGKGTGNASGGGTTSRSTSRRAPKPRPLSSQPQRSPAGPASDARRALEVRSAGPLAFLHRLPRWLVPVLMGALLLAGLLIPAAWAGVFLLLLAAFLGWLVALSWPIITPGSRALRLVVVALVIGAAVMRFTGRA